MIDHGAFLGGIKYGVILASVVALLVFGLVW